MLNCPKCGKEIEEGSVFCSFCGEFLLSNGTATVTDKSPSVTVSVEDILGVGNSNGNTVEIVTVAAAEKPKKRKKIWPKIIAAILCLLLVAGGVMGAVLLLNSRDSSNASGDVADESEDAQPSDGSSDDASTEDETASKPASQKLKKDALVGDWCFSLPATQIMPLDYAFESDAEISLVMRFGTDDTVHILCTTDDYTSAYGVMLEDYFEYLRDGGIYDVYEKDKGYSKEQVDDMLDGYGMSIDVFVDAVADQIRAEDPLENVSLTDDGFLILTDLSKPTTYSLDGNKLCFVPDNDIRRETYFTFEYVDNTITVLEGDYAEGVLTDKILTKK